MCNQREYFSGEMRNMAKGTTGGNENWVTWNVGYNWKIESMSWSNKTIAAYHHGIGYHN